MRPALKIVSVLAVTRERWEQCLPERCLNLCILNGIAYMLKRVSVVAFVVCSSLIEAQNCTDLAWAHRKFNWSGTQPLLLLTEYNPWAMVVGSDSPTFALYADGTAIYWEGSGRSGKYLTATLATSEVEQLLKSAHLDRANDFESCYSIEDGTDAPTNVLVVKTEAGYKTIDVYGIIRHSDKIPPSRMPADLQVAFRTLLSFNHPDAHEWKPAYIEVMMWPFSYAKSSVRWPAEFPGISDKNTRHSPRGLELFVPYPELDHYEAFVSRLKPTTAVLMDGKKWAISQRLPFPHEGKP
jgi:hypothetical protein